MQFKITQDNEYYWIDLNGKRLGGCYDDKELIKAVIGLLRSSFNITDDKLKEEKYN